MLILNHPILKPALPFVCRFHSELEPGNMIIIKGFSPPSAKDFVINLALGENFEEDDPHRSVVAFHFNPRFNQCSVVRNTYQNGWGLEQSSPISVLPFTKNKSFEIIILVTADCYVVAGDQKHYITYKHRIPYQRVNTLHILKDIYVETVALSDGPSGSNVFHAFFMPNIKQEIANIERNYGNVAHNLAVPFETAISQASMRPGNSIYMCGRPITGAHKFNVDLSFSGSNSCAEAVAFQFSVVLPQRVVVRNTRINGRWGQEERDVMRFPFEENFNFEMKITFNDDKFIVFVNNQYLCDYNHRFPYSQIDRFGITGDVYVRVLAFA